MTGQMHLVDFVAGIGNDSTDELLDEMRAIDREANGWVNIRPRPEDNPDPSAADLAPTPPPSPLNIFGRRRAVTIEGTWVPGAHRPSPPRSGSSTPPGASRCASSAMVAWPCRTAGRSSPTTPDAAWC